MNLLCSRRFLGGLVSLGVMVVPIVALAQGEASWTTKGSMPFERAEISVAAANGKIYVIGGQMHGVDANSLNQEYDPATGNRQPATGMWQERALMPAVTSHAGAATLNGKVYVVGGFQANVHVGAVSNVFEYDPATDQWRRVASLAAPRGAPGVVALDGKLYAIGGRNPDRVTVDTTEIYDPAADTWTPAAPLPAARDHLGIAVLNGRIHVFGGRLDATVDNTTQHDIYDPATDNWSAGAPLNVARSAGVVFIIDGRIVWAGGECKDRETRTTYDDVEVFDPETNRWTVLPPMPIGRHAGAGVTVGSEGYILGGAHGCGTDRQSKDISVFRMP